MSWLRRLAFRCVPGYAAGEARKRLAIPAYPISPEYADENAVRSEVWKLVQAEAFDEALDRLRAAIDSRETTVTQTRLYELILRGLFAEYDIHQNNAQAAERATAPFRAWAERHGGDPDVDAIVARALQRLGVIHRGFGWAKDVGEGQWRRLIELHEEAAALLERSRAAGGERLLWRRVRFEGGIIDADSPQDLRQRFDLCQEADPGNLEIYRLRARQLLPRWHGSLEELEAFARMSVERTRELYGAAVYAQIYLEVARYQDPAEESLADWPSLSGAFEDCLKHWPREIALNEYARMAAMYGEIDVARQLFLEMREARLDLWAGDPFEVYAWIVGALQRRPEL